MKVILNQTVPKVGKEGTVVSVADGFARNYLFPRGLAIVADKNQLRALEIRNVRLAAKSAGAKTAAEALKEQIDGKTVRIPGQVGKDQGKLFGAITSQNVADAIRKQLGVEVDKRNVALIEPIKRLGDHTVEVDLHREVDAKLIVQVFDPAAEAAAAPVAVEPELVEA
jgi:large subunit ribosomal protein L9